MQDEPNDPDDLPPELPPREAWKYARQRVRMYGWAIIALGCVFAMLDMGIASATLAGVGVCCITAAEEPAP
jgi:hypothetical protein